MHTIAPPKLMGAGIRTPLARTHSKKLQQNKWYDQGVTRNSYAQAKSQKSTRKSQIQHLTQNSSLSQYYFLVPYLFLKIPQANYPVWEHG